MLLTDIAGYLVSTGCGYAPSNASYPWIYGNYSPDTPDKIIVVSDYVAEQPLLTMTGNQPPLLERPRVQIMCRDAPQEVVACHTTIRNVYVKLCLVSDMVIGTNRYTFVPLDTPVMIGRDDQQRVKYAVNFQVEVQGA